MTKASFLSKAEVHMRSIRESRLADMNYVGNKSSASYMLDSWEKRRVFPYIAAFPDASLRSLLLKFRGALNVRYLREEKCKTFWDMENNCTFGLKFQNFNMQFLLDCCNFYRPCSSIFKMLFIKYGIKHRNNALALLLNMEF